MYSIFESINSRSTLHCVYSSGKCSTQRNYIISIAIWASWSYNLRAHSPFSRFNLYFNVHKQLLSIPFKRNFRNKPKPHHLELVSFKCCLEENDGNIVDSFDIVMIIWSACKNRINNSQESDIVLECPCLCIIWIEIASWCRKWMGKKIRCRQLFMEQSSDWVAFYIGLGGTVKVYTWVWRMGNTSLHIICTNWVTFTICFLFWIDSSHCGKWKERAS